MNIKDPEVHRMAHELARRRGVSATEAVRQALRRELELEKEDLFDFLMDLGRRSAAKEGEWLTDDDLYDEVGAPR